MENYKLGPEEVFLYRGNVLQKGFVEKTRLLLTNENLVFITKIEESTDEYQTEPFLINEIKMYQGMPQIKAKGLFVEIFLTSTEKEFTFESKIELHKFIDAAVKLLTGKSKIERGAEKVKKAKELVVDTLGEGTLKVIGNIATKNVSGVLGAVGKKFNKKK